MSLNVLGTSESKSLIHNAFETSQLYGPDLPLPQPTKRPVVNGDRKSRRNQTERKKKNEKGTRRMKKEERAGGKKEEREREKREMEEGRGRKRERK